MTIFAMNVFQFNIFRFVDFFFSLFCLRKFRCYCGRDMRGTDFYRAERYMIFIARLLLSCVYHIHTV